MHIAPFLREHSVQNRFLNTFGIYYLCSFVCVEFCRLSRNSSYANNWFSGGVTLTHPDPNAFPPPFPPIATARWYKCVTYCFMIFFERIPRSKSLIKQPNTFSVKCSIYMSNSYYIFSCSNKSIKVQARKFENF